MNNIFDSKENAETQLIADFNHEVRTHINSIICIAELLSRTELNKKQCEYLNMLKSSSESLMDAFKSLLGSSIIESDNLKLNKKPLDLIGDMENKIKETHKSDSKLTAVEESSNMPASILVVDDNEINRKVASAFVLKKGYTCLCASNGMEAIEALSNGNVDLILMDIQMPVLNGYETTKIIRQNEKKASTRMPIIAMTAYAMPEDRQKCIDAGMDEYISKPIDAKELYRKIENFLGQ